MTQSDFIMQTIAVLNQHLKGDCVDEGRHGPVRPAHIWSWKWK